MKQGRILSPIEGTMVPEERDIPESLPGGIAGGLVYPNAGPTLNVAPLWSPLAFFQAGTFPTYVSASMDVTGLRLTVTWDQNLVSAQYSVAVNVWKLFRASPDTQWHTAASANVDAGGFGASSAKTTVITMETTTFFGLTDEVTMAGSPNGSVALVGGKVAENFNSTTGITFV